MLHTNPMITGNELRRSLKMPIRYKVVKKKTRMSCMVNGNSKYALQYLPETIVTAKEGTLGIMTFTSKYRAELFMTIGFNGYDFECIKVEAIGRGTCPHEIANHTDTDSLEYFYDNPGTTWVGKPPLDTMCYPAVKVLE